TIQRIDRRTFVGADVVRIRPHAVLRIIRETRRVERIARPGRGHRIATGTQVHAQGVAGTGELGEQPALGELVEQDHAVTEAARAGAAAAEAVHVERSRGEAAVGGVVDRDARAAGAVDRL